LRPASFVSEDRLDGGGNTRSSPATAEPARLQPHSSWHSASPSRADTP
jgi:hypothetical protein